MLSKETSIAPSSLLLRDWAIFYASMNLPIIPLYEPTINGQCSCYNPACSSPGKHPRTVNGLKDASTDILTIQSWWNKWPKANIGIITGKLSGKIVIDIDPKNGGLTSLEHLEEIYSDIPGAKVKTGGNGFHFYLEHPITKMIKNKVNIMPGIDIRGDGGYIVAPPSTHYTGGVYEWLSPISNSVNIPEWFFNLYDQNHSIEKNTSKKLTIESGGRNNFLTSVAGSLKKHGLDRDAIQKSLDFLNQEFCIPRLNITELLSITKSIERYNADSIIEWESPLEIKPKDIDIYPIDSTYLPEVIKEWVIDIATRMQVSFELIAVPAIVAIGSVIGRKIRIYPKKHDNWVVTPNLWGAIVAKPGMLKSPAISEALAPLEAIVRYENSRYEERIRKWERDKIISMATIDAIKAQLVKSISKKNHEEVEELSKDLLEIQTKIANTTPRCKRLKTNDATIEKLVEILIENPNGLLLIRDELSGWLLSLSKPGREGDREFWLESWSSRSSYTVDRIGRGTVHVGSLCLSIFGAIQPDKLDSLLTNPLHSNDDGLLQRFQLILSPSLSKTWTNHDTAPNATAQQRVEELFKKIHNLDIQSQDSQSFVGVHFDDQAQDIFNTWRENLEKTLRQNELKNSHYEGHLSKYRSLIPALALIFEVLYQESPDLKIVGKNSLLLALKWSDYLIEHAKKIYRLDMHRYETSIHSLIQKIQTKKIQDGDTVRSILRKGWEHLSINDQVEHSLGYLEEHHWLKIIENRSIGRPSRIIKINPSIYTKFA